jgi:predicted dehydrogenase
MLDTAEVAHHSFQDEIDELVDGIIHNKESPSNLEDAVNPHEAALAAIMSQKEGKPIKLPLI